MKLTAEEIAAAVGGVLHTKTPGLTAEHISTASGSMKGDDLFVPLLGARVDAHRFIPDAFTHGAALSFTSEGLANNGVHEDLSCWLDQGSDRFSWQDHDDGNDCRGTFRGQSHIFDQGQCQFTDRRTYHCD